MIRGLRMSKPDWSGEGTGLTLGAHALKHGSEAQIFTEWGGSTAHYANILISSWEFGKDPGFGMGRSLSPQASINIWWNQDLQVGQRTVPKGG